MMERFFFEGVLIFLFAVLAGDLKHVLLRWKRSTPATIEQCRQRVDRLDDQLHALLCERMRLSVEIGRLKTKDRVQDGIRETRILHRLTQKEELTHAFVVDVWERIFRESKRLQYNLLNTTESNGD